MLCHGVGRRLSRAVQCLGGGGVGWGGGSAPTCCVRHDQSLLERLLQRIAELPRPAGSWRLPRALAVGTASPAPQPSAVLRLASKRSVTVGVHCGSSAPSSTCSASPRRASTGAAARPRRTAATLWAGGPRSSSMACPTTPRTRHVNSTCRGLPARMWQWQWQIACGRDHPARAVCRHGLATSSFFTTSEVFTAIKGRRSSFLPIRPCFQDCKDRFFGRQHDQEASARSVRETCVHTIHVDVGSQHVSIWRLPPHAGADNQAPAARQLHLSFPAAM
jgi:hypothetical protein